MTSQEIKKAETKRVELLKDRRDYRTALIQRRQDIESKLDKVEKEIRQLTGK